MKPLIGITSNFIKDSRFGAEAHIGGKGQLWQALADDYIQAVRLAGGIPVMIPVIPDPEMAGEYLDGLDGLIVSGGADVSPLLYGADMTGRVGECCPERDEAELSLIKAALDIPDFPVLGICRGCQILNVALGGTLVLDMDTEKTGDHFLAEQRMQVPTHRINMVPGSYIGKILGNEDRVNSYHHQCVDRPGEGVVITARDSHGVPECIEVPQHRGFMMGTQWHPEGLASVNDRHLAIFCELVKAAEEYKKGGKRD